MRKICFLSICLFVYCLLSAQPLVSVGTTTYTLNPSLLGLNGRSTEGPSWTNAPFLSLVQEMNPAYVRYPAGTQGNQWNWKTGTFIASLGLTPKEIFTIPMFVNGLPQGAKIIYMVNMVLPTEQTGITFSTSTDTQLATDATLTAKLTDILNALDEFNKAGQLPDACEIGNELYFSNVYAGVYANNPAFYMQHAKIIALAIKNKYPAMKIILCTTKGGTTSRDNWNTTVFNAINADVQLKAAVYGVVQHHYINDTYGNVNAVTDNVMAKTIIDEGITYVAESAADYSTVPSTLKLWVTEYGATKITADGMWCSGLRTATLTLSFMKMGPKVDNLLWHHITDDPNVLTTTKTKLGPAGIAFSLLSKAMNGCSSYKKLVFSNMLATNDYAGLTGYKFMANGVENILILNTENISYSGVNLASLTGNGTLQFAKQYWSSTPYLPDVSTTVNISVNTSTNLSSYVINPFSITVFSKQINTSNSYNTLNVSTRIYPNPVKDILNIEGDANFVNVYDIAGSVIGVKYSKLSNNKLVLDFSNLKKGIYFVQTHAEKFKVIKM